MSEQRSPIDGLQGDLKAQQEFVQMRAPVYARVLALLAEALPRGLAEHLERAWVAREFGVWYERPLLLLASLRDDTLREGPTHPLWRALAAPAPSLEAATRDALDAALAPERAHLWRTLARRHLQTNEPSRAVAWLWPASLLASAAPGRPLALFDVGASAGLNLVADRLPPIWQREDGAPLPVAPLPPIASRRGFDLRPLDVCDDEDARWLRACIWPGQKEREARLALSIDAFRALTAGPDRPVVERVSAGDVPTRLPSCGAAGPCALAYQTVVRDYLPPSERERYEHGMRAWLRQNPRGAALWVELEVTPAARTGGPPSAITAHLHLGGGALRSFLLSCCDPHPTRLQVDDEALRALTEALKGA